MADLPLRSDLFQVGRRAIVTAPATRLNPKIVDVPGSDLNLIVNSGALMGEELARAFGKCMRGNFAATARGDQLDRKVMDATGGQLPRKPASPATTVVVMVRPTDAGGGGTINVGSRVTTAQGVQFQLDADVVFNPTDLSAEVGATAVETGPRGNVVTGLLTQWIDQPFDSTIEVTNTEDSAGGDDVEDDVRYVARYFSFFPTLSRGVLGAIEFGALSVPGVQVASAFEILNPFGGMPAAAVEVVIGDRDGRASSSMLQAVKDIMLRYRAAGIPVYVSGGIITFETVRWRLAYASGINTVFAQESVRAVVVAASQFLAPGATMLRAGLIAAAQAVPGVVVHDDSLIEPAGDVVPTGNDVVLRVRPQDVYFA